KKSKHRHEDAPHDSNRSSRHSKSKRRSRRRDEDISPSPSPPPARPDTPLSPTPSPKPVHPPIGPYGRRRAGPQPPPVKSVKCVPRRGDRRSGRRGSDDSGSGNDVPANEDEVSDGDRENVHVGRKREAPRHAGNARKRKKTGAKSTAAIEALELATEQTLKDINKWLDDTPRFSEFSSASNSPSHYLGAPGEEFPNERRNATGHHIGATAEEDTRKQQRDKQRRSKPSNTSTLEAIKERRTKKDVQRTIERLQPGKSKGNLIANLPKVKQEDGTGPGQDVANNVASKSSKDGKNNLHATKTTEDESAPKLSLGSVLKTCIGGFADKKPILEDKGSEPETEEKETKEVEEEDKKKETKAASPVKTQTKPVVDSNKATPNLSAWFKAFGAPKAAPPKKKVEEAPAKAEVKPEPESIKSPSKSPEVFQSPNAERAPRHRNLSAGSSVSDLSSAFSQDMEMSEVASPRDRMGYHQSPPALSPASPRVPPPPIQPTQHFPINGTIKVGFYQDTSSQKSSPDKGSPREEPSTQVPTPQTTPTYPQYTPPPARSYPTISNPAPVYEQPPVSTITTNPQFAPSLPTTVANQLPQNYNQSDIQYYDTSKPLTDQYRDRQPSPPKVPEPQQQQQQQQEYIRPHQAALNAMQQEYSKLQQQQQQMHQQYQAPIPPGYLNANTTIKPINPPVIIPQQPIRNMPNNLLIPPVQPQPPQPDPKVMQQYPVKKRMVYSSTATEYSGMDVAAYQNQQRLVPHPSLGIPYYDPTSGSMLHQPPYDLTTPVIKETPPPPVAKPKRGRKKAAAAAVAVNPEPPKVPENLGTAFQHYVGLGKDPMGLKPSVPGSAFNFGAPGLTLPTGHSLYNPTEKEAAFYAAGYRNYYDNKLKAPQVSSPNMIANTQATSQSTTTQQQTQCISGPTSPQSPFSFLGQPSTASRAPQSHPHQYQQAPLPVTSNSTDSPTYHQFQQMDQKTVSAYYHHQFSQSQLASTFVPPYSPSPPQQVPPNTQTPQATNRAPPTHPAFMMESSPLYQQYFQRHQEDLLLQQRQLHQGLLGAPAGYPSVLYK
ncbi:hypothetical protein B566_EDAN010461, partial [Ephemera danica]